METFASYVAIIIDTFGYDGVVEGGSHLLIRFISRAALQAYKRARTDRRSCAAAGSEEGLPQSAEAPPPTA